MAHQTPFAVSGAQSKGQTFRSTLEGGLDTLAALVDEIAG